MGAIQRTLGTRIEGYALREKSPDGPDEPRRPEVVDTPNGWTEDELDYLAANSLTVPGRGDRAPGCGDYLPLKYCPACGEPELLEKRCKQRSCPACQTIWMGDAAERATVRLAAAREAADDGLDRRAVHVVVSPPEGAIETTGGYESGARRAHLLAKDHGVRGGVVIPHGYRVKEGVIEDFRIEDPDMGIWKWIFTERVEDWRSLTYFSPHFHVIGLARDVKASDPDGDDGWITKRIGSLSEHSRRKVAPYEDLYGLAFYLLSHASYDPESQSHVPRWFGSLSYNSFSPESALPDWKVGGIERMARTVREDGGLESPDWTCRSDGCGGILEATFGNARDRLSDPEWCAGIATDTERRLTLAVDWLASEVKPPPGLRHPRTQDQGREALEAIYDRRHG